MAPQEKVGFGFHPQVVRRRRSSQLRNTANGEGEAKCISNKIIPRFCVFKQLHHLADSGSGSWVLLSWMQLVSGLTGCDQGVTGAWSPQGLMG